MRARLQSMPSLVGCSKRFIFGRRSKRVISLFMSGGPSQLDLFDFKPLLNTMNGKDLPESVRMGQRLTGMSANQATLPMAGSIFKFARHGKSGAWVSELLPHTAGVVDELCLITSLYTEAINHDPAITFFQTGATIAGRPSLGSWLSYGLGSINQNLPTFCVLISQKRPDQPLYSRLWGNGFLPSVHQGVEFRPGADPVLFLENPPGVSSSGRRKMLDRLRELHQNSYDAALDPSIQARIAQYEMAYRMQTSVPEVMQLSAEPDHVFELYGADSRRPGTFAANCLLARRLAERDVRFIQLYHPGWDHHGNLPGGIRQQCRETDQPCAALDQRPQAARPARRHASALGRGVRPNELQPGQVDGQRLRPRPSPALLHRLGGRRGDQTWHHVRGDRSLRLQRRLRRRSRPRFPRDDSAPPRHRSRAIDVQAPGALLPTDGRLRQGRQRHPGVKSRRTMPELLTRSRSWRTAVVTFAGAVAIAVIALTGWWWYSARLGVTFSKDRVPHLGREGVLVAPGLYMIGS